MRRTVFRDSIQVIQKLATGPKFQIHIDYTCIQILELFYYPCCKLTRARFMSLFIGNSVLMVSDQVAHKPGCTATEDG